MEQTSSKPRLTGLLSNETLARVERMRLVPNRRRTNRAQGEHLSGKGGTSIEFSDYRDYVAGDDIRRVDWNIFARLQRPYLKLYSHEEEMHVTVLVDASSSMRSEEKFDRAKQLAAAFSIMGLMGGERVSVFACNHSGAGPEMETRMAGRVSTRRVFRFLENLEPGGNVPVEHAIESMLRLHHGRGIAIVLSDFLTFGDVSRSFNLLYSAGLELFALQLLGPTEIDPEITGDVRFVDSETGDALDISSAGELLGLYHEHRLGLEQFLGEQSRKRNGRFVSQSSGDSVERVLFETLLRQGWVQ